MEQDHYLSDSSHSFSMNHIIHVYAINIVQLCPRGIHVIEEPVFDLKFLKDDFFYYVIDLHIISIFKYKLLQESLVLYACYWRQNYLFEEIFEPLKQDSEKWHTIYVWGTYTNKKVWKTYVYT